MKGKNQISHLITLVLKIDATTYFNSFTSSLINKRTLDHKATQ